MSESDAVGAVAEPPAEPVVAEEKLEGTTPEEVAQVLNLPVDKPAVDDGEEGDDPDEDVPHPAVEDAADKEDTEDEEVPEDKKSETKTEPVADTNDAEDKYSFQIEDANGATFKITADAKMEDILSEFEPKNNGQVLDILEQLREVKDLKKADELQASQDATKQERREAASKFLEGWKEEAKALQGAKRIPEGEDGDKRVDAVYKFMADENTARQKAGKPTLNSFEDALDKLENKEARDAKVASDKADKDTARKNGALVGGSSSASTSGGPIYKAGTAKNANQAIRSMGLLE